MLLLEGNNIRCVLGAGETELHNTWQTPQSNKGDENKTNATVERNAHGKVYIKSGDENNESACTH